MSEDAEILSPPYPKQTTTRERLWLMLQDLRGWTIEQRSELEGTLPFEKFGELDFPAELGSVDVWNSVSVPGYFTTWNAMRQIRSWWDHTLRNFEDSWECKACLNTRAEIVKLAITTLRHATVLPEKYEFLVEQEQQKGRKFQAKFTKWLEQMQDEDGDEDGSEDDMELP